MSDSSPKKPRLVERLGHAYLRRLDRLTPIVSSEDAVHILNSDERKSLIRIERFAILWASLTGVMSALVCAFSAETAAFFLGEKSTLGFVANWKHYALTASITGIATVAEILLMYLNALIAVHRLSRGAGIELFDSTHQSQTVTNSLANAALDLPLVNNDAIFVRPGFELSRWKVVVAALVFKLKVSLSYYLAKFVVQRTLGRIVVRWAVELVAVPIYAFWNAWTTRRVLHQARVCVMGPSAILQLLDELQPDRSARSEKLDLSISLTAGITIARNPQLHPNVLFLSQELWQRFGKPEVGEGFSDRFIATLVGLSPSDQKLAICYLLFNAAIDGQLSGTELAMIEHACRRCGLVISKPKLEQAVVQFVEGKGLSAEQLYSTIEPIDAKPTVASHVQTFI